MRPSSNQTSPIASLAVRRIDDMAATQAVSASILRNSRADGVDRPAATLGRADGALARRSTNDRSPARIRAVMGVTPGRPTSICSPRLTLAPGGASVISGTSSFSHCGGLAVIGGNPQRRVGFEALDEPAGVETPGVVFRIAAPKAGARRKAGHPAADLHDAGGAAARADMERRRNASPRSDR